jgi:hypothetical protein
MSPFWQLSFERQSMGIPVQLPRVSQVGLAPEE